MKYGIIDKNTLNVVHIYESDNSLQSEFGGDWSDINKTYHAQIPAELEEIRAVYLEGYISSNDPVVYSIRSTRKN